MWNFKKKKKKAREEKRSYKFNLGVESNTYIENQLKTEVYNEGCYF